MGVQIRITNRKLNLFGLTRVLVRVLKECSSYRVAGYYFSTAYRNGYWDGRISLLRKMPTAGEYSAPIGVLDDYLIAFRARRIEPELIDERDEPEKVEYGWDCTEFRDYQLRAISRILRPGLLRGVGIINMPIRSGKTKTAAGLIRLLGVRTLFVVPSKQLLIQTRKALGETLCTEVGQVGDGVYEIRDVTVVTVQSLVKLRATSTKDGRARRRWDEITTHFGMIVIDECHHMTADEWRKAVLDIETRYRVGLSATAFPSLKKEQERGVVWLKACCGPVRIKVSMDKLIADGYLTPARVIIQKVTRPKREGRGWSQSLKNECILQNPYRNEDILRFASEYAAEGSRVLVVTNRLAQVDHLIKLAKRRAVWCESITGKDLTVARAHKVARFIAKRPAILIGTVLSEGVDIPEVDVVINAEGGKDLKTTIQRMRNLTVMEGKDEAVFIDFYDDTNKYFRSHSNARIKVYREYQGFIVERRG